MALPHASVSARAVRIWFERSDKVLLRDEVDCDVNDRFMKTGDRRDVSLAQASTDPKSESRPAKPGVLATMRRSMCLSEWLCVSVQVFAIGFRGGSSGEERSGLPSGFLQ
jgi:hypothetical protein